MWSTPIHMKMGMASRPAAQRPEYGPVGVGHAGVGRWLTLDYFDMPSQ